jgi:large subunit ribosomal protein L28
MAKGLKCDNCEKGVMYGHNVSHAKNRTRKIFKPNLHSAKVVINGVGKTLRLCTKCQRLFKGVKSNKVEEITPEPQVLAA